LKLQGDTRRLLINFIVKLLFNELPTQQFIEGDNRIGKKKQKLILKSNEKLAGPAGIEPATHPQGG